MANQLLVENQGEISSVEIPFLHVEWKIPYSLLLPQNTEHSIDSPRFHFKDSAWHLRVTVKDYNSYKGTHIYLVRMNCTTQTPDVYSQLEIKTSNGETYKNMCFNCIVFRHQISSALGDIVLCGQDLTLDKDILAPNGVATVFCNFLLETSGDLKTGSKMELSKAMQLTSQTMSATFPLPSTTAPVPQFGEKTDLPKTSAYSTPAFMSTTAVSLFGCNSSKSSDNSSKFDSDTNSEASKTPITSPRLQCAVKTEDNQIAKSTTPAVLSFANFSAKTTSANFHFSFTPSVPFSQFNSMSSFSSCSNRVPYKSDGILKLIMDFKNLLNSAEDSDVIFKVKDKEFKAHKSIIRARSPVFYAMFSHDMWEKNNGAVDITDCEPETFKIFLLYLYNGRVESLSTSTVFDLYRAADKYDVKELKSSCKEFMLCNLSLNTVCDVIEHALQYEESGLLEAGSDFFSKNFKDVILTVKWQCFLKKNPVAANELLIKYSAYSDHLLACRRLKIAHRTCISEKIKKLA